LSVPETATTGDASTRSSSIRAERHRLLFGGAPGRSGAVRRDGGDLRATDEQHDLTISAAGGRRGRTRDPTECGDFVVDAYIEGGEPGFETECRSD